MPSGESDDVPMEAVAVARRYRRVERPVSGVVALRGGVGCVTALFRLPLLYGLLVAAAVVVVLRAPVLRTDGEYRLTTRTDPEAVREAFASATPPPLALQWGCADDVESTPDGGRYEISYLLGLRSDAVVSELRSSPSRTDGGDDDTGEFELVVTADGGPWATYAVSIAERDGTTTVDVEYSSDRRFGLRRLPQQLVARRYRDDALTAQGYTVVRSHGGLTL